MDLKATRFRYLVSFFGWLQDNIFCNCKGVLSWIVGQSWPLVINGAPRGLWLSIANRLS